MLESKTARFDSLLEARWKLLQDANSPQHGEYGWRAKMTGLADPQISKYRLQTGGR
jgi:hypothetical protein